MAVPRVKRRILRATLRLNRNLMRLPEPPLESDELTRETTTVRPRNRAFRAERRGRTRLALKPQSASHETRPAKPRRSTRRRLVRRPGKPPKPMSESSTDPEGPEPEPEPDPDPPPPPDPGEPEKAHPVALKF